MSFTPTRFLDPKTDVVFKKIFGNNPDLIKSFLNSVLPLPSDGLIETVEYLTPEQSPTIPTMKNTIVDVKCKDQNGRIFIVEMQLQWTDSFAKRLTFGVSKAYVQQLNKGETYDSLCPVYGLGIINAAFDNGHEWYHHYKTINVKDNQKTLEGLELVFIELPKFKPNTWEEKRIGVLWLRFLKEMNEKMQTIPQEFEAIPEIHKAMELSQESAFSMAELEAYDKYWDAVSVEKTFIRDAHKAGKAEGLAVGKAEGLAVGKAEGERQAKLDIAKKLLAQGIPLETILQITGLKQQDLHV